MPKALLRLKKGSQNHKNQKNDPLPFWVFRGFGFWGFWCLFGVLGGLWATLPDAAEAGEGLEMDPGLQKLEKTLFLRFAQKSCFFMFLKVRIHLETFSSLSGIRQSCPKPSQDPKKAPKPPKPKNPKNPRRGTFDGWGGSLKNEMFRT